MTKPDVYYGPVAENYDASRAYKAKWRLEMAAVDAFLSEGPVLDVPFGTGRFVPIYRAKGLQFKGVDISADMLAVALRKYPGVDAQQGSIFDLPFRKAEFATAVCVRFLEWLPLDRARVVIDRLRDIAETVIVTIVHGTEGRPDAFTYDLGKFLGAIDGLFLADRRVTAHVRDMISEAFKLRPARWADVLDQFRDDYPGAAEANIQRLADKFGAFFSLPPVAIDAETVAVRAEYWTGDKIAAAVRALADHRFITDGAPPRRMAAPATVIERDGLPLMIDGRHRANHWMKGPGPHPVLVVRPR